MASTIIASKTIINVCENTSAALRGSRTFIRSEKGSSSISRKRKLATPVVDGFWKKYMQKEFEKNRPLLLQIQGERVQTLIMNRPGVSGVVGILRDK